MDKIRFGTVGIHGYSRSHIANIRWAAKSGHPVELAAIFAYMREQNEEFASELESSGIKLVAGYDELLEMKDSLDCITLPVGIPLHKTMGVQALEAGFNVYLEKPIAGSIQDADALASAEQKSGKKLFIGYQHCFQPYIWELKRRLTAGDIGKIKKIIVAASYPRKTSYFTRNSWAGKLSSGGTIVLDSPLNNACAHFMNLALFLAGSAISESATPETVEAELYRVNDIKSADTVSTRVRTAEKVEIVWTASHASEHPKGPFIRIEGSSKVVSIDYTGAHKEALWKYGHKGSGDVFIEDKWGFANPFSQAAKWLKGETDTPVCGIEIARPQTIVVNGAHTAAKVVRIPDNYIEQEKPQDGDILKTARYMAKTLNACYDKGCTIHETGCAPWSVPAASADVRGLSHFKLPGCKKH